jgi:signal transduction histidine kinase
MKLIPWPWPILFFMSRQEFESKLSKLAAEACDSVMKEMSAEMHDSLVRKLSVFNLRVETLGRSSTDPVVETQVIKMRVDIEQVTRIIKNIYHRLWPVREEGDTLVDRLERLLRDMEDPGVGHIHFTHQGEVADMDHQVETHILRIVEELVQNAFKHSYAWHVWIRLTWGPGTLTLEVEDDGTAFSKIPKIIRKLRKKNNTLKMRTQAIGTSIEFRPGKKGLLAKMKIRLR